MICQKGKVNRAATCAYEIERFFRLGRGENFILRVAGKLGSGTILVLQEEWQKLHSVEAKIAWIAEKLEDLYTLLGTTDDNPGPRVS